MNEVTAPADIDSLFNAARDHGSGERSNSSTFEQFVAALRHWIIEHYDLPGSHAERLEKTRLLLYLMVGATTLGDALVLLGRFRKLVWGDRAVRITSVDGETTIVLEQPAKSDVPGLLSDLWSLAFLLAELEFLVGVPIDGAVGQVRQAECLPASTVHLLYARPLTFGGANLTLVLPSRFLDRRILARPEEVDGFVSRLVPRALGEGQAARSMSFLVAGMIQTEARTGASPPKLGVVAALLGLSEATLRRRLLRDGLTFRTIKDRVLDELAKEHLAAGLSVELTAERLGYSDAFAFRRAFRQRQHCNPSTYRKSLNNSVSGGTA